jgi:DNA primase
VRGGGDGHALSALPVGVRFSADCYGRPAVLFPLCDQAGAVVACNGRHTDGRDNPKAHSGGAKRAVVFATPGALTAAQLVLVEAPIDALSLAAVGVPAVALCGTSGPAWLPAQAVLRPVALAFDADAAGDQAAAQLRQLLASVGATVTRWRPEGAKDWNELLLASRTTLLRQLAHDSQQRGAAAGFASGSSGRLVQL